MPQGQCTGGGVRSGWETIPGDVLKTIRPEDVTGGGEGGRLRAYVMDSESGGA